MFQTGPSPGATTKPFAFIVSLTFPADMRRISPVPGGFGSVIVIVTAP